MFKFFLVFFSLPLLSFSLNSQIYIHNLSFQDKNFTNFTNLINTNKNNWLQLKDNFIISDTKNIKPLSMAIYKVKENDTLFSIAEELGLNSDTLISFNALANSMSLNAGDTLLIPSMDGIVIFPATQTTTERIARIYNIPEVLLLFINSVQSGTILPKEEIFIPFGKMSDEEKNYFIFQPFSFPLDSGRFSSNYGKRFHPIKKRWIFHGGVDIATPSGSSVYATADGEVIYSGIAGGYGNLIVIRHKYGYTSWYGHLSSLKTTVGQKISNKEIVALSGNTGISTGPHLHFEIRRFNLRENPMEILTFNHQEAIYETENKDMMEEDSTD